MFSKVLAYVFCLSVLSPPAILMARDNITGAVFDAVTGKPVTGAVVTSGQETVLTDAEGRFVIRSGGEKILARAPGYRRVEQDTAFPPEITLMPFAPKALYLSFYGVGSRVLRQPAVRLIEESELNALVIDVKGDRGMIPFRSTVPLAEAAGATRITTIRDLPGLLESLKAKGIYTIARIVVFKDPALASAFPDLAVKTERGEVWTDGEGLAWVDPFRKEVWDYDIAVAAEAAKYGFDEIQFDYVRFPDRKGLEFSQRNSEENRVEAIRGFLAAARKKLEPYNVFLSADIFGYACWNTNDTWIGQRLEDLAPNLDYISPMLYPSGFQFGIGEYKNPLAYPYEIVLLSLNRARERTGLAPVRFRPWLQAFRDYAFDRRRFKGKEIRAQTTAADNFGSNGWMLWNPSNIYTLEGLEQQNARMETEPAVTKPLREG